MLLSQNQVEFLTALENHSKEQAWGLMWTLIGLGELTKVKSPTLVSYAAITCPHCDNGMVLNEVCHHCDGSGKVERVRYQ